MSSSTPWAGETYDRSTKCIAFEGRIVVVGFAGGTIQAPPLSHALVKNYAVLGLHWGLYTQVAPDLVREAHAALTRLADEGVVAPVVSERFGLDAVADGVQRLADGTTVGRVCWVAERVSDSPRGLDLDAFGRWLADAAPGLLDGPLSGEVIAGGRSNLTYRVTDGTHTVVVRRPPLGHVLATAHDMGREYRVISALAPTAVPVPEAYASCADDAVVGAPFYVMGFVDGTPYRLAGELETLGPVRTRTIGERMVDTLADLHARRPRVGRPGRVRPSRGLSRAPGASVGRAARRVTQPATRRGRRAAPPPGRARPAGERAGHRPR